MLPASSPTEADRIALKNIFKAIADYGRSVRLRRQVNGDLIDQEDPVNSVSVRKRKSSRRKPETRGNPSQNN